MLKKLPNNDTLRAILLHALLAAVSLFINGFGIHLTIRANIGAGPWDVLNLGLSKAFGILYGNVSVIVSATVILVDLLLREPIGIAIFIDALVVGKSVDFFNFLDFIRTPQTMVGKIVMMLLGLAVIGYTQATYMWASLGCGPRDTLLLGMKRRIKRIPIGVVEIDLLAIVTMLGYVLGGPVGIGTLIFAFAAGPIMQLAFHTLHFDAMQVQHQKIHETVRVFAKWKQPE